MGGFPARGRSALRWLSCLGSNGDDGSPRLLVSVRSAVEADTALAGGATVIDIKEPSRGSLGAASWEVQRSVVEVVQARGGRRPVAVTAALGELLESGLPDSFEPLEGLSLCKLGLAGCRERADWMGCLEAWRDRLASVDTELAAVAYADSDAAVSPDVGEILDLAVDLDLPVLLIDTFEKNGQTLLDYLGYPELQSLLEEAHGQGVAVALAGSLRAEHVASLVQLGTDVIAVRGAACEGGARGQGLSSTRIRALANCLEVAATS